MATGLTCKSMLPVVSYCRYLFVRIYINEKRELAKIRSNPSHLLSMYSKEWYSGSGTLAIINYDRKEVVTELSNDKSIS